MSWWSDQTEGTQGGILGALGGVASGLFGYKGTKAQNIASAKQAKRQMDFQERMSNTAHQRQMADMRKAGLNPILSAKYGGASSPAGQQAPQYNKAQVALQNASTAANVQNIMANTAKTLAETSAVGPTSVIGLGGAAQAGSALSTAKDMVRAYGGLSGMQTPNIKNIVKALQPSNIFLNAAAAVLREMNIPYSEKHSAAKRADKKYSIGKSRLSRSIHTKGPWR